MDLLTPLDRRFLARSLELGRRGWGRVQPNPMVGCVLVRDGVVVAEGWHAEYGGPHAERVALDQAGAAAAGSVAYVSLEPCAHTGKTPPCADALVAAGVTRVVYGAADPGRDSGGGARRLAEAGIEVVGPLLSESQARQENPAFFHRHRGQGPYLALKLAVSLDGRISARTGQSSVVTGPASHEEVHRLRAGHDAIVVGSETALIDDPRLTVRQGGIHARVPPARVVLDTTLRLPLQARLFEDVGHAPLHLFTSPTADPGREGALLERGAIVHRVAAGSSGLDLDAVLDRCVGLGFTSLLVEGGARLASSLLRDRRVHRLYLFTAPRFLGPDAPEAFPGGGPVGTWRRVGPARLFVEDLLTILEPEG
ncbi:MAG: bifunctional diaminohydroxyphosphoribosylaminopyrimidine deaminase/5-amino-6-(5-phosphoribosylamino)uracil reductase RibD [Gemmatimonadota bacterium]